ncbi:MAG: ABC transporter permease [Erysipelotrichaceae bacterium]|nr:ABC transporter permease [Erysipelotrichaceae bacterium]
MNLVQDLKNYREFLKSNVKKDIRGKYKGSFLGVLWSFINPLLSVLVYAIVFPYIMRIKVENYLIYLITGIIPWTFFTSSINMGMISILSNADIIKKVYFPRIILPISTVTSCLVNFLISCVIILLFCIGSGLGISIHLLWLPLIAIIQYVMLLGFTFILSAIEMYMRDIEHIVNFILSMAFYVTPILYTPDIFPDNLAWVLKVNPMSYLVNAYRSIFFYQKMPDMIGLLIVGVFSIAIFLIGYLIFEKLQKGFAEEV